MIGIMNREQCEQVLRTELVGRIGCCVAKKVYVVPVTYVYHDNHIYARSKEGMKISMMRKNSSVCFQVDSRVNLRNWRSVIVWGKYEELKTMTEQKKAMSILSDFLLPYSLSESLDPVEYADRKPVEKQRKPVMYRISVAQLTGRFEKE